MAFFWRKGRLLGTMGARIIVCFSIVNQNHPNKANLRLENMPTFRRFRAFSHCTKHNPNRFRQCRTNPDHSVMKCNRHAFSHDGRPVLRKARNNTNHFSALSTFGPPQGPCGSQQKGKRPQTRVPPYLFFDGPKVSCSFGLLLYQVQARIFNRKPLFSRLSIVPAYLARRHCAWALART